jgi:flagellar hook-associated protein 1 FlgK
MADFAALHTAVSALRSARVGLDVTSNNVANASTPGYTRQRVTLQSTHSRETLGGLVGTGVTVGEIGRVRDQLADVKVRSSAASLGYIDVKAELLGHAELAFGEPEFGISGAMNDLWDAFDELSLAPSQPGARANVVGNLETATAAFRQVAENLTQLDGLVTESLTQSVSDVNEMLNHVAQLNEAIVGSADTPADLADRRDVLLDELSTMIGVKVIPQGDGAVRVTLNGLSLVSETNVNPISINTSGEIEVGGIVVDASGNIGGMQAFLTDDLAVARAELDALAADFATALNTAHSAGFSESGPGGDLVTFTPGAAAASLRAVIADPDQLATASSAGPPFPANDPSNAENLAGLRDALAADGGSASLSTFLREIVTDIGQKTAAASSSATSAEDLYTTTLDEREAKHGVSLDEEMISLMEYQRMYEAASRVITAVDQALDVLVNRTGLVGR